MGASAVFLEDQAWPKRCGHMAGKKVVPAEVMEAKIRATMAERLDAETLICVRTDARAALASAASGQRGHAIKCARRTLALKRARRRAERPIGKLVLEAPYTLTADVAASRLPIVPVRTLMKDQFRSDA
jgi:isocitrate lyase